MSVPAPKRCFLCELQENSLVVANSTERLRILGVLVQVEAAHDSVEYPSSARVEAMYQGQALVALTLDDGTGLASILVPSTWLEESPLDSLQLGEMIEALVWLRRTGSHQRWYASQVMMVPDPQAAEVLRWCEISHPQKASTSLRYGYPTLEANEHEALRLITFQSKTDPDGVSLEDLALVLDLSKGGAQELIVQLQLGGQIYQNQQGNYVPL